ncbi:MAG: TonB-dependent receptor [Gammaproteobacteria bacterium]
MSERTHPVSPLDKALAVNLSARRYGTFAEIGAGQEVVRWFFQAGGAAGTISKSISAYDMTVSDAIYGDCPRYVCRERLQAMLDYEQDLNLTRLADKRGDSTAFFTFADTVSARNFQGTNECHGWMGIKFQSHPRDESSQIVLHVRMLDVENTLQQEALGIVGVNLVYGACFLYYEPDRLVESLLDSLSTERIEIDMIEFSGIEFRHVENRVMSLRLVQLGLTGAAMFSAEGRVLQPSEVLRKRPVLVERGRFRPVTHVNLDMIDSALAQFEGENDIAPGETVTLMEITMHNLRCGGTEIDLGDFLARADVLATTGHAVLISDYFEYYRLAEYLARYTSRRIGIAMGAGSLADLFDERYYAHLQGGILESFGRLFKNDLRLYIYPMRDPENGALHTVANLHVGGPLQQLYRFLVERGCVVQLTKYNEEFLRIQSPEVLSCIQRGDMCWESMVPASVAEAIRDGRLFGYAAAAAGARR